MFVFHYRFEGFESIFEQSGALSNSSAIWEKISEAMRPTTCGYDA